MAGGEVEARDRISGRSSPLPITALGTVPVPARALHERLLLRGQVDDAPRGLKNGLKMPRPMAGSSSAVGTSRPVPARAGRPAQVW